MKNVSVVERGEIASISTWDKLNVTNETKKIGSKDWQISSLQSSECRSSKGGGAKGQNNFPLEAFSGDDLSNTVHL